MRAVIVGATDIAVMTARTLLARGHEVVLVEADREKIESLYDDLDCSFLHGDGSRPAILREAGPERTDILFALADNDQVSILSSLVGRSLGFRRIVTSVEDPELEPICVELGLESVIVPPRTISRYLADMVENVDVLELSTVLRGEARFFMFRAGEQENGRTVEELELPRDARVICVYRRGEFRLTDDGTHLEEGDAVVILTHSRNLPEVRERWTPVLAADGDED